ncbi:MAG: heat-inducible transcriptional repressor HrcA [Kordiimonadaceae bacterium]|jgi:heat-inducible transcriptional repressor|nr:heat-inducible transcriptional repressor HrcA [Kordiimonadaceae bacterium]MBT6035496.1 heat-inducible transcriptional repressor HrcA [Kordiimonadaceae bacterium]MBT6329195.1 heat-inducible transcriptional repressor HrcA [Kordiimonadaceae bacterium]MBT7583747.1 heat-inducible transcriptional repressor HrcA [Kordiimonadaceae bacterium]
MMNILNERSREIFRQIVDAYIMTGEPVGSRTLSKKIQMPLSPASVRNVMADLEESGLIYSPFTSAGRIPTDIGLRLFVDGLLEVGNLTKKERNNIEIQCKNEGQRMEDVLVQATSMLSGLSHCASMVMAPKRDKPLKHIEFVQIAPGRALVVMVSEGDDVENRVIDIPPGITPSALIQAANYINSKLLGHSFEEAKNLIEQEISIQKAELDGLTQNIVEQGLAVWSGTRKDSNKINRESLIVRGQANLLDDLEAEEDLERVRLLFSDLERKKDLIELLGLAKNAEGVRIFIGSENNLFSLSGSSVIAAPYMDEKNNLLGVIGVIGPTRLNYARIIPMVDYTAKIIGKIL